MNETQAPEWYAEGLRFECQRCGRCCTGEPGYVWVTQAESKRMAEFRGVSAEEFGRKYLRKAGAHDSLIELPDGRCIFYANKSCIVYPARPTQCRTFPFWVSVIVAPEAWTACGGKCPGIGKGRLYSHDEIEEILRSASVESGRPRFRPR